MKKLLITIVLVAVIAVFSIISGRIAFSMQVNSDVEELFANAKTGTNEIVSESDFKRIPKVMRNYLYDANILGRGKIQTARLKQSGVMKMKQGSKWSPMTAEEYFTMGEPAFIWYANIEAMKVFFMTARDTYIDEAGRKLVKLMSIVRTADKIGFKVNEASLMRYLSEMIWFPTEFVNRKLIWQEVDENTVKCMMNRGEINASVLFHFNDNDEIDLIQASRYRQEGKDFTRRVWYAKIEKYGYVNDFKVPTQLLLGWELRKKQFPYARIVIDDLEYNVNEPY